jgi:HK97 family phage portal protein
VAIWPLRAQSVVDEADRITAAAARAIEGAASWTTLPTGGYPWESSSTLPSPVSKAEALAVPAVSRGIDLLATTVASLPIERLDSEGLAAAPGWIEQPEPNRPRFATFVDTARDLILDGVAYWLVRPGGRDSSGRLSRGSIVYAPADLVIPVLGRGADAARVIAVDYAGETFPADRVIAFTGWHDGIRRHGSTIIRTAIALEQAARNYAQAPTPSLVIRNTSTYELSPGEISQMIDDVKRARQASAIGYVNAGVDLQPLGFDAAQLQLVEARAFTNAQISNLLGVPQHFIAGSSVGGSSMTYSNVSSEGRTLVDYGMKPLLAALESRLSMHDVSPARSTFRFSLDALLRGNPLERAQLYAQLIPLGVLTVAEAREWEDLTNPKGSTI